MAGSGAECVCVYLFAVRGEFQLREDNVLAQQLQEQECELSNIKCGAN